MGLDWSLDEVLALDLNKRLCLPLCRLGLDLGYRLRLELHGLTIKLIWLSLGWWWLGLDLQWLGLDLWWLGLNLNRLGLDLNRLGLVLCRIGLHLHGLALLALLVSLLHREEGLGLRGGHDYHWSSPSRLPR